MTHRPSGVLAHQAKRGLHRLFDRVRFIGGYGDRMQQARDPRGLDALGDVPGYGDDRFDFTGLGSHTPRVVVSIHTW